MIPLTQLSQLRGIFGDFWGVEQAKGEVKSSAIDFRTTVVETKYLFSVWIADRIVGMYLRFSRRLKDGKEHRYWSVVESKRCAGGRVVQRPVLYLGEINDSQREAWCRNRGFR